jgi:mono/diheme cytochrome c family protein
MKRFSLLAVSTAAAAAAPLLWADQEPAAKPVDFQREVRPILSANCFACHGPHEEGREAELRLDVREDAVMLRDDDYQVIVPGDAEASELIFRITDTLDPMPPEESGHHLSEAQVEILRRWINEGAEYAPHWSFETVARPTPPRPELHPIDAFVLARLHEAGLTPAEEADRDTLIRRLSLDLTGLPPTLAERMAFQADTSPDAYEKLVDRLLASPHYGERWAAVWLDLARYADSKGHGSDPLREIWRWRDWVIEAYNADMPYDRFTLEQMAGDLLPDASVNTQLATAFHRNSLVNTEGGTDNEEFRVAAVKDRTNLSMQVWMGLTFGCAECHTHKFDPITHEDYYSTFAIFNQTTDRDGDDDSPKIPTPTREQQEELKRIDARLLALSDQISSVPIDREALRAWEETQLASESQWQTWNQAQTVRSSQAAYVLQPNQSLHLLEDAPDKNSLVLAQTFDEAPTALRLQLLADPALPGGGPGASPNNGNFVLSEARIRHYPSSWIDPQVKFVRLSLEGEARILSLAEVEVLSQGVNLARQAKASQSSTSYDGPAALAIDGNTDGRFEQASVTHTATEANPWFELELAEAARIESVRVWTRTDTDLYKRLRGLRIELFDAERKPLGGHWQEDPAKKEFSWSLADGGAVRVLHAQADFEQEGWTAAMALDGNPQTGWAIGGQQGRDHEIRFLIDPPVQPGILVLELEQNYGSAHIFGRLRPQWSFVAEPPRLLPSAVREALAQPRETRNSAAHAALEDYFRSFDPGVLALEQERAALQAERKALKIPTTPVLVALGPEMRRTTHIFDKGNFLSPLEEVEARVPSAFTWGDGAVRDRLEFARWLTHPNNPLTPRVAVNRVWARLFGRGLVLTEEDFGAQGSMPTHPELLDWLASEYQSHWSQKRLLKTIVMSETYRQASTVTPEKLELDPLNVLMSRGARFRLPAEAVRDQALLVSGLLSRKMFGPSVFPPQPDGLWQAAFNGQRSWVTDTDENRWRRGVYVFWRRSTPYPSMTVFDAPSRETCTIRRIRTNTPLQAFVTLNDPVYVEAAQALGRRMLAQRFQSMAEEEDGVRIRMGLEWTLGRKADPRAIEVLEDLLNEQRMKYRDRPEEARQIASDPLGMLPEGADPVEYAAWTIVGNVLLNQDAFLTRD